MTQILRLPLTAWDAAPSSVDADAAITTLEQGGVVLLPQLPFVVNADENKLLSAELIGDRKNVSLDPKTSAVHGTSGGSNDQSLLHGMMRRYSGYTTQLLKALYPSYAATLQVGRTSFRPVEAAGRKTSWRKDDTRLHVDAFPSTPTHGRRILRVFANINPNGKPRVWKLGDAFTDVTQRFAGKIPRPLPGAHVTLSLLGLTKSRRTEYDHYMLRLHDDMKADADYQARFAENIHEFFPGWTWMVFTDQVPHAVLSGQYLLEQTFYLPVDSLRAPQQSPLRVLEKQLQRSLI